MGSPERPLGITVTSAQEMRQERLNATETRQDQLGNGVPIGGLSRGLGSRFPALGQPHPASPGPGAGSGVRFDG